MAWRLLSITGLLIILVLMIRAARLPEWKKVIARSKYRALMPYIVAQARHETGDYNSKLYKEANSLFGIKTFKQVTPYPSREGGYYKVYANHAESARDLLRWFELKKMPEEVSSAEEYAGALKIRGYFTDNLINYVNGLKRFL